MPLWFNRYAGYNQNSNGSGGGNGRYNTLNPRNAYPQAEGPREPYPNNNLASRLFGSGANRNLVNPPANAPMNNRPNYNRPNTTPIPAHSPSPAPTPARNTNNNAQSMPLPDGVRFEPLDEDTKRLYLNAKNAANRQESVESPKTPELTLPVAQEDIQQSAVPGTLFQEPRQNLTNKIEGFIQNERNASIFYSYLSKKAPREDYRKALEDISHESKNSHMVYNTMYKNYNGQEYLPKDTAINNAVSFHTGLAWAIMEESKALKELSDIYENIMDEKTAKSINKLIYKKISDLSMLHLMNTNY